MYLFPFICDFWNACCENTAAFSPPTLRLEQQHGHVVSIRSDHSAAVEWVHPSQQNPSDEVDQWRTGSGAGD